MANVNGTIVGSVTDSSPSKNPVVGAIVVATGPKIRTNPGSASDPVRTDAKGEFTFANLLPGDYVVNCSAFGSSTGAPVGVPSGGTGSAAITIPVGLQLTCLVPGGAGGTSQPLGNGDHVTTGTAVTLRADLSGDAGLASGAETVPAPTEIRFESSKGTFVTIPDVPRETLLLTDGVFGWVNPTVTLREVGSASGRSISAASITAGSTFVAVPAATRPVSGEIGVTLRRSAAVATDDLGLWAAIRTHAKAISFGGLGVKGTGRGLRGYQGFIEQVLCEGVLDLPGRAIDQCGPAPDLGHISRRAKHLPMHGMAAYELLKTATEIFLLWNCGVIVRDRDALGNRITSDDDERARSGLSIADLTESLANYLGKGRLPYIERIVQTAFPDYASLDHNGAASRDSLFSHSVFCTGVLTPRADCACLIELIWSYWHEEGMLVQSMNAISQRFQNVRAMSERDPLAHVTIDPLRPLNNLLWGYVQDEQNRLTVKRRGAEYDHEYGITLRGRAVPNMRPADSRSKFLEGFHNLLHMCSIFYKEDNDTTVIADGFPLLNALKEVHLLLAQGAHNQFGDLPWTARVEMMVQQWLLARPEMRDFLQSRPMVPYTEAWMPQVDTMKTLQGWSDVTVTHFHDLAAFGEQILLSIRYGDWIDLNDENHAKNWARYWRPEIQSYIHAYRTVTGIDLTNPDTVDSIMPAMHLQRRLALQRAR